MNEYTKYINTLTKKGLDEELKEVEGYIAYGESQVTYLERWSSGDSHRLYFERERLYKNYDHKEHLLTLKNKFKIFISENVRYCDIIRICDICEIYEWNDCGLMVKIHYANVEELFKDILKLDNANAVKNIVATDGLVIQGFDDHLRRIIDERDIITMFKKDKI